MLDCCYMQRNRFARVWAETVGVTTFRPNPPVFTAASSQFSRHGKVSAVRGEGCRDQPPVPEDPVTGATSGPEDCGKAAAASREWKPQW